MGNGHRDAAPKWLHTPRDRRFTGKVIRVGQILGRKKVRTDEATERVDTKVLETLVQLDAGQQLPTGLRVDSYIQVDD